MNQEDIRIRILWIDDCEGQDAGYMYPEKALPEEFAKVFQIVKHREIPGPSTIRTPADFPICFDGFWSQGDTDLFPADIVAMDYNLKKWVDTSIDTEEAEDGDGWADEPAERDDRIARVVEKPSSHSNGFEAGFEGLVIGIFSSSLLSDHPIGIVPMTNYGDLLEGIAEVRAMHSISTPILNIDYSQFGVSGEDRSWKNVLTKGVQALRQRIESLWERGTIAISMKDLMSLCEDDDATLEKSVTIHSKYCDRSLPVAGLFVDYPESERKDAAELWARRLLEEKKGNFDEFQAAAELAGMVWDAYNSEYVEHRRRLSELHAKKTDGAEREKLDGLFGVVSGAKARCTNVDICCDIFSGDYSDRVRRWATVLVVVYFLEQMVRVKKNSKNRSPIFDPDDVYLAIFPVPFAPLVLDWHKNKRIDKSSNWVKRLLALGEAVPNEGNTKELNGVCDQAIRLENVLMGERHDVASSIFGLTSAERHIVRSVAVDLLPRADWDEYIPARRVFYGSGNG